MTATARTPTASSQEHETAVDYVRRNRRLVDLYTPGVPRTNTPAEYELLATNLTITT